jgi:hypothetical protein
LRERPRDSAQRWASILTSIAVIFLAAWMTYEARPPRAVKATVEAGAPASSSTTASAVVDAGPATAADDLDAGLTLSALSFLDATAMPSSAPRTVKIGVVLINFAGAEGAPPNARSKKDAQGIAERIAQDARSDFSHAVTGGDPGSSADIGRLPRGVLDPRTEVSVFALAPGEISDVLETPKGYWIVKRLE